MKQKFKVTGMTCASCAATVERTVKKLAGVQEVAVNLLSNTMAVTYDQAKQSAENIITAVTKAGYHAAQEQKKGAAAAVTPTQTEQRQIKTRLLVSLASLIPLMYLSMGHMAGAPLPFFLVGAQNALSFALTQFLLTLPIAFINYPYFQNGFKHLVKLRPNMDSLIAIGSSAALLYGIFALYQIGVGLGTQNLQTVHQYTMDLYFESAGTILTLITLGKFLEAKSKGKTSEAITKLLQLAPKTATVLRQGEQLQIPVEEVVVGDRVLIKPGQSIPVDGTVTKGSTWVDQSAITGESIPVLRQTGDTVLAATVNQTGAFEMRAQKVGSSTTLSQIIALVEEANASKAPIAKLADKISGIFVPVVMAIAVIAAVTWLLLGYSFSFALSIGIAVLVISCPCALGLATPVAIMAGTGKGAEYGILIKSAQALEIAHSVKTVVLDKTGTITEGKPKVTDILPTEQTEQEELLKIASSLEQSSEHPLGKAVVDYAQEQGIARLGSEKFQAISGQGVTAEIAGQRYYGGNLAYVGKYANPEKMEEIGNAYAEQGKTPLYFARAGQMLGVIAVADMVKSTSLQAVEQLRAMRIEVVMLTGDHKKTAQAIQKQLGIGRAIAEVMPQDKEREIRALKAQGQKVAMVGDGVNDAPALARADVGIAIGAGTDIAIEAADIVLMHSKLTDVVTAIRLSKATIRNIKENLFWAFFYNSVGIPLAAGVFFSLLGWKLNPMFGAAAMSLSSVCVVLNALRLKFFKPLPSAPIQKKERHTMTKIMKIEGMNCGHCKATVEKALNHFAGVCAEVDLEKKCAVLKLSAPVDEQALFNAVNEAGFRALSMEAEEQHESR